LRRAIASHSIRSFQAEIDYGADFMRAKKEPP